MKKTIAVLTVAILAVGSMSASATEFRSNRTNVEAKQQFTQQTVELRAALAAKDAELAQQNTYGGIERGYEGPDAATLAQLQRERREIKDKLDTVASQYGLRPCCL